jgi:prepilin-type N-terminal cleavage/methylation domain-containing protein
MKLVRNTHYALRNTQVTSHHVSRSNHRAPRSHAFTLIEIMVVIGIMAIVMTMSVPMVYKIWRKEPMRQALSDVQEVLMNARRNAIMSGSMAEVVFHPRERRFEVSGGGGGSPAGAVNVSTGDMSAVTTPGSGLSGQFSEDIAIRMLDINLMPFADAEAARVRFYPNGTCDEMMLIIQDGNTGEQRGVTLEITTSLTSTLNEADLQNLRNGRP